MAQSDEGERLFSAELDPPKNPNVNSDGTNSTRSWISLIPNSSQSVGEGGAAGGVDGVSTGRLSSGVVVVHVRITGVGAASVQVVKAYMEVHSLMDSTLVLRFNHKGLVACAHAGTPHSNGSKFFISIYHCDWLDKKTTIFGKVTGHSLYNLLRLGEVKTYKDDRPLDPPPKITSAEVLWNPFDDIVPRRLKKKSAEQVSGTDKSDNKDAKKKGVIKKLSSLSFGEEAEQAAVKQNIKRSEKLNRKLDFEGSLYNDHNLIERPTTFDLDDDVARRSEELLKDMYKKTYELLRKHHSALLKAAKEHEEISGAEIDYILKKYPRICLSAYSCKRKSPGSFPFFLEEQGLQLEPRLSRLLHNNT